MPTSLTAAELTDGFSSKVRARGLDYFYEGRVTLLANTLRGIAADVTGSDVYSVEIRLDDDMVHLTCGCDAFEQYEPCKHIWAAILAADAARERRTNSASAKTKKPAAPKIAAWVKQLDSLSAAHSLHTP